MQSGTKPATAYTSQEVGHIWQRANQTPFYKNSHTHATKKGAMLPTAAQFSGAVQWAHKQGLTGKRQIALIVEGDLSQNEPRLLQGIPAHLQGQSVTRKVLLNSEKKLIAPSIGDSPDPLKIFDVSDAHARSVIHVLHQMVPDALLLTIDGSDIATRRIPPKIMHSVEQASIVNMSYLESKPYLETLIFTQPLPPQFSSYKNWVLALYQKDIQESRALASHIGKHKLIFRSAGNDGDNLSSYTLQTPAETGERLESVPLHAKVIAEDAELQNHLILVGTVNESFLGPLHNYPGDNKVIQNHFICTLGRNIRTLGDESEYELKSGTSLVTPIAAGAALLLMEKFPILSIFEIKEALLESASKTFIWDASDGQYTLVYDPLEDPPHLESFYKIYGKENITLDSFTPELYGKGILDLRAAIIYGKLLSKEKERIKRATAARKTTGPRLSPQQLRIKTKVILRAQEEDAATRIQRWVREKRQTIYRQDKPISMI